MCQKIANTLTACPKCRIQWDNYISLQEKREEGEDLQNWLLICLIIFILKIRLIVLFYLYNFSSNIEHEEKLMISV